MQLALVGFLVGVGISSFFAIHAWVLWAIAFVVSVLMASRHQREVLIGIMLIGVVLGIVRTNYVMSQPSDLWDLAGAKKSVTMTGFVDGDFELTKSGGRWRFQAIKPVSGRILVLGSSEVRPRYGQIYELTGTPQQPKNSGGFDYIGYLAKDGIHAQMFYPKFDVPTDKIEMPFFMRTLRWIKINLAFVRDALAESLARFVPETEASFLNGIIYGIRGTISQALTDAFARTGTSHILAISGYNITIIAAVLGAILARFGRTRAYWLTLIGIVAFTLMVGASASVVRAAIMGILAITAIQLGRASHAGTAILLSASLMALYNPRLIRWDVGFQLSFLAVVGIVYLAPIISQFFEKLFFKIHAKKFKAVFISILATTISANIMVLPLILFTFGVFAVYTLPVNLLVLPLVPLAMLLGFITSIAGLILPFAGLLVGQIAWLISALMLLLIRTASALPHATLQAEMDAPTMLACYVTLAVWLWFGYRNNYVGAVNSSLKCNSLC